MPTQTLEFSAGTGLVITCKLFALGDDTVIATATASEKFNDKNRYTVLYTDLPAGTYRLNGFVSGIGGFVNENYEVEFATGTYQPKSESAITNIDIIPTTVAVPSILEAAGFDPTKIIVYRGTSWIIAIQDLGDISNLTKIWFTLRKRNNDTESQSIVQIEMTAGLVILNGSTSVTASDGDLTIQDDLAGDITITLKPESTQYISPNDNLIYDIKGRSSGGTVKLLHKSENLIVSADVTRKIT